MSRVAQAFSVVLALSFSLVLSLSSALGPAHAQPVQDPAYQAAKTAFDALSQAERSALQRDLVWIGQFTGVPYGDFTPQTFAAIKRFETTNASSVDGVRVDGILAAPERAALGVLAINERKIADLLVETDALSGMKIAIPRQFLVKHTTTSAGLSRWQDKDEKVTLDLMVLKPDDDLKTIYEKAIAPNPGRTIIYKFISPTLMIIWGETEKGKFYRRIVKGEKGELRGFSFGYEKALAAKVDRYVIAAGAYFEAFPGAKPVENAPPVAAKTPASLGSAQGAKSAVLGPKGKPFTALLVGPNTWISAQSAVRTCSSIMLTGGQSGPVQILKTDAAAGLVLLGAKSANAIPLALETVAMPENGVVLQRDDEGALLASPAVVSASGVAVPLQTGGAGAAMFDKNGALAGIVITEPTSKFRIAGTSPVMQYSMATVADIAKLADIPLKPSTASTPKSTGEIAASAATALVVMQCMP